MDSTKTAVNERDEVFGPADVVISENVSPGTVGVTNEDKVSGTAAGVTNDDKVSGTAAGVTNDDKVSGTAAGVTNDDKVSGTAVGVTNDDKVSGTAVGVTNDDKVSGTAVGVKESDDYGEPTVEIEVDSRITLKREYGLTSATSLVVGIIIGSGIFISPQGALRNTGSVGLCMVVWLGGALLSMLGGLTFTELVSVVRRSGGHYSILYKSMGPIPAFLVLWSGEITNAAGRAVQALSFASYVSSSFENCGDPMILRRTIATTLILCVALADLKGINNLAHETSLTIVNESVQTVTLTFTNIYSVKLTARLSVFFTVAKMTALALIIGGGIYKLSQGVVSDLPTGFEGSVQSPSTIALAFYSVMFAYGGWENANAVVEEIRRPRRNAPLATIGGIIIVAVVYLLTNLSYLTVLTKGEMLASEAVAVSWGQKVLGQAAWIIPVSVIMSVFGSANNTMSTSTRTMFVAARDGVWFEFLSYINVRHYTPIPSILVQVAFSIFMVWYGTVTTLINFLGFTGWLMSGLASLCVVILRYRVPDDPKRIKIPLVVSLLFTLWCGYLVVAPIVQNPQIEILYGAIFVVSGLVLYFPLFFFKLKPKFMNKVEMYLQLLMEVVPGGYDSNYSS